MRVLKRFTCAGLALVSLLALLSVGLVSPAWADKTEEELAEEARIAAEVAELEQQKKEKENTLKELEAQIAEAKEKKLGVMAAKSLLDQRNQLLLDQIDDTQGEIETAAAQIALYEQLEQEQYALFCQQVRSEEERGSLSYLSVLFKASSIADLLNRLEFVNEVAEYNKELIAALKATRENIAAEKAAMEELEADLSQQQDTLMVKLEETTTLMEEYAADQAALEEIYAAEEAASEAIAAEIKSLLASSDVVASNEDFIWPVSTSRKISSPMGYRTSPGGGIGSSNHKGVDICNVGFTSSVYAVKSGKVLRVSKALQGSYYGGSGYGNYVVIDHGDGVTTLYGHLSNVKVDVGQTVAQGDVIGITGSTGASTGPHLHYEVMIDGAYQDPLNYLPGYIAAW